MRLTAAPDIAEWLGTRPQMEWDAGNSTKSQTKHGFRMADVESILEAAVVFAGRIVEPAHDEARYLLLGVTSGGRHAALVFAHRGDRLRPISCRAMREWEKEVYDAAT
ncbi:MAG TPA: BrnT family toxin [Anaeromyxobacteraceae bacterium]|nr:BrnT family toxin [Anaeromyxobacteraceae bacterium]